jgi:hypothetical protein
VCTNLLRLYMKCFIYALAAVFFLGCKKSETETPVKSLYPDIVVGIVKHGDIKLENEDIIKAEWQKGPAAGLTIVSLEIEKSVSKGDVQQEFYMLVAKTAQGTQLATLLKKQGKEILFDKSSGIITSCSSKKGEKFKIQGNSRDGKIRLYCDNCAECEKTEAGM